MRKLRPIAEAEVIAEFLRNEFYQDEFHHDRQRFEHLVLQADTGNQAENALRRALLFRRRGHMWRELPTDTQWWEAEIENRDLDLIHVFPRAPWRQLAGPSFQLREIVNRIRAKRFANGSSDFVARVQALSYRLRIEQSSSSVLLIGVDEHQPLTILEGNHRLTAALLVGESLLRSRFRVLVGFSPRMTESCWYETNLRNLWRYGKNRLKNLMYDKDADVERVLRAVYGIGTPALENSVPAPKAVSESK
jgi:hypothetical protein